MTKVVPDTWLIVTPAAMPKGRYCDPRLRLLLTAYTIGRVTSSPGLACILNHKEVESRVKTDGFVQTVKPRLKHRKDGQPNVTFPPVWLN